MPGLLDTGLGYQKTALSGFVRQSAEQQKIDQANKQIDMQQQMAEDQATGMGLSVGAFALMALFSDERLKTDIAPFRAGLAEILKINPITFRYLENTDIGLDASESTAGVSAQNVAAVIPEAVQECYGYLAVQPMVLIVTLINAVQELSAEVAELERKVPK